MHERSDTFLSTKPIAPRERLIVALDVPSHREALEWVDRLGDSVHFYKLGFELFLAGDYLDMLRALADRDKRVFVDLKLFDVPETVAAAVRQLAPSGATLATVHGNESMLRAACEHKKDLKLLAVTVLTSIDRDDFADLGIELQVEELVLSRARRALACGCDGVISSGAEARALRAALGGGFLVVSPGIRPLESPDDHKRVVSAREAFLGGADYVVVGRPIRRATDPRGEALCIQETISELFDQNPSS